MPALNFKKRFAGPVESGTKRQTIRARRPDGRDPRAGDTLFLYTGMRTRSCRKLGQAVCKSSEPILISRPLTVLAGNLLGPEEERDLARADGFDSVADFKAFFLPTGRDQFDGRVIRW